MMRVAVNTIDHTSPLLGLSQRLPPSNLQAEQALLGALLANNLPTSASRISCWRTISSIRSTAACLAAIARRIELGQLADAVTLKAEFEHSGTLDEVGGTAYLAQLLAAMVGIINAGEYGRAIHDAWLRRQLVEIGETVVNNAFGAEPALDGMRAGRGGRAGAVRYRPTARLGMAGFLSFERALTAAINAAERAFHRTGGVSGLTTGLRDLDKKTGGLHKSDLLILAGRPGMGKSALATKIAFGAARALLAEARGGRPACRAEIGGGDLLAGNERRAARHPPAGRGGTGQRRPHPPRRDRAARFRPVRAGQLDPLRSLPLHIDDTAAITLSALRTRCRRLKRTRGAGADRDRLPAADAPVAGHAAGEPGAGNQP